MNVYKLGNKVKCIIRSFSSGKIGDVEMKYGNQPYTVLNDIEAQLSFQSKNRNANAIQPELNYNLDYADTLRISNVKLTDRILNLIFTQFDFALCHVQENYTATNGKFYLPMNQPEIYQLFIYNEEGQLVKAEGRWDKNEIIIPEDVRKESSNYLVFYSYPGKGYALNRNQNIYLTLDLEVEGNKGDTQDNIDSPYTYFLHFEKCSLSVDKNLYFTGNVNTIDLNFKILHSDEDYITISE